MSPMHHKLYITETTLMLKRFFPYLMHFQAYCKQLPNDISEIGKLLSNRSCQAHVLNL